jgi:putative phosphoesterase
MKIGILSDTHDDIDNVKEAIYRFKEQKVELIIHAGDFVFPGIIDEFKTSQNEDWHPKLVGVLGNNDGEKLILLKKFVEMGGELHDEFFDDFIDGLRFGIYHGTSVKLKDAAIGSKMYDVFIYGHTHIKEENKIGDTIVLNPGTGHKKVKSASGVFQEGGTMVFDTQTKETKYDPLP